jgi:dTDP-4-dehydrorhamnose reductase
MDDKNAEKSNKINVIGTHNAVALAKTIGALKLHFISTAYVANGGSNVYEKNKAKAEKIIELSNIPYTISRLSVVIGDAKTGEITDFSGLYGFFLTAYKILKSTGFNTQLNVEAAQGATLNLITADWAANCLFQITHKVPQNKILNIVDNNPMTVKSIIHEGATHIGIRENLIIHNSVDTNAKSENVAQLIFNRVIEILRPYTCKNFSVNDQELSDFLGKEFTNQTTITPTTIATALDFALVASGLEEKIPAQQAS